MKLIDNWTKAWRFTSVQTALIIAAVSGLYAAWPAFSSAVPVFWYATGMVVLSLAVVVLRLIQQNIPSN
jgi:hypothetical protein